MVLKLFSSYSATYRPISMKIGMLVNDVMSHMLTNFCEVLSFHLGFIGFLMFFCHAHFLNDPITAIYMQKFNFF